MQEGEEQEEDNMELVEKIVAFIKQEQLHPEILTYHHQHYQQLNELLKEQRKKLRQYLDYDDQLETGRADKNFRYAIYSAEIEKIQYLLKMYLRIRLKKIQLHCFYLTKQPQPLELLLSLPEQKFLSKYAAVRFQQYKETVFKQLNKNFRDFKGVEVLMASKEEEQKERRLYIQTKQSQLELRGPDMQQFVFAQIVMNQNQMRFGVNVQVSNNGQSMHVIPVGTVIYCPYSVIKKCFTEQQYRLI